MNRFGGAAARASVPVSSGGRYHPLRGLGDVAAVQAMLARADAKFAGVKDLARRVMPESAFGPIDRGVIDRIRAQLAGKGPGWYAQIGAAELAGVVFYCLRGVAYHLSIAHALMNGPNPDAQTTIVVAMLTPAAAVLDGLERLLSTAQTAEDAMASFMRTVDGVAQKVAGQLGLQGVSGLGLPPLAVVGIVFVVAVVLYLLLSQMESMIAAGQVANQACSQPGVTCTSEQWAAIRDQALQASSTLSILPNLGRAVEQAGSLVFWGGLLAVGAVLAYGAWITQPAATITRDRLRAQAAARLQGIRRRR